MRTPDFWNRTTPGAKVCAAMLAPLGALYGLSVQAKRVCTKPFRLRSRVVCVGNLTVGGSGKTPVAIALAQLLAMRGKKVVFLSRGYGGRLKGPIEVDATRHSAADVGDEPLLLAATAPTIVARDRALGAKLGHSIGADVLVMDDGFQNFQVAKDLSLVVVDAAAGFGNGCIVPAGPLRERVADGLARADAVVLMRRGDLALPGFKGTVLRAHMTPHAPQALHNEAVLAFAGIGHPERFFDLLHKMAADVRGTRTFADHHEFGHAELASLRRDADALGARLVTTEKDFVRLPPLFRDAVLCVPIRARFDDDEAVGALLDRLERAPEAHAL